MSVEAEIVILFKNLVTLEADRDDSGVRRWALPKCVLELEMIDEADLHCWVSLQGEFEYTVDMRAASLLGETSLDGRLWRSSLGRYWNPEWRGDYGGDPARYASILGAVLDDDDVQWAWYGAQLTSDSGCRDVAPVSRAWVKSFFGATSKVDG